MGWTDWFPWGERIARHGREWRIRLRLAKHALRGTDFVRQSDPGHLLTRRSYRTDLPDFHETPEAEHRAAILGRATEAEQLYVIAHDLREKIESGDDDLIRTVSEMAVLGGYDGDLQRCVRLLEEKYRDRALSNIRKRLEVSRRKWDESGMAEGCTVTDPRLQWRMDVQTTARDLARAEGDEPPHVRHAIDEAPREILAQMANAERAEV